MTPPGMGAGYRFLWCVGKCTYPPVEYVDFPLVFRTVEHTENVNIDGKIY